MPVKNKNRQSNSGYEGVITGLNDEEKKVLEDAGIGGGDSIFDITPYLTSETSMSIEGYNALREFVLSNKGGMIKMAANDSDAFYYNCMSISLNDIIFSSTGAIGFAIQGLLLVVDEGGNVQKMETFISNIPELPSDASTKTYTLKAVNGVLTWVEG